MSERRYAAETTISETQTLGEIEELARKHGVTAFARSWEANGIRIVFVLGEHKYRIELPFPDPKEVKYQRYADRRIIPEAAREKKIDQDRRSRARALLLMLKAILEARAIGLVTAEEALLPYLVLPNQQTVAEWAGEQQARFTGYEMPALLPGNPLLALTDGRSSER